MTRLCWIFVFLVVVAVPSDARPHKCEQRERSLADLDLAEDALKRARDLYPNCEDGNDTSNSSECGRKDKSLGFLDVALDLVSNAKKSIPFCPEVTTEEPLTTVTTEKPTSHFTTEKPTSHFKTEKPTSHFKTEEPTSHFTTEKPTSDFTTEKPTSHFTTEKPTSLFTTEKTTSHFTTEEPTTEIKKEDRRPMDCQDLLLTGIRLSGVYTVWPQTTRGNDVPVQVRCDMDTDGGGWTVFQRRGNFSKQENFDRGWNDYKNGFGNLEKDFWLGNDHLFDLSNQGAYSLRLDMTAKNGESAFAVFREFRIEDEDSNYKLHVGKYESNGTAGDSMTYSNSEMFSTKDRWNNKRFTRNCAEVRKGGFWYSDCAQCNPNGMYKPGVEDETSVFYDTFKARIGLFSMEMKLKRL